MNRLLISMLIPLSLSLLAACTVQPLYGVDPVTRETTQFNVSIDNPADRDDQLVRNALLDLIGSPSVNSAYRGKIVASVSNQTIFQSNAPHTVTAVSNRRVTLTATLVLSDSATGDKIIEFVSIGRTFYESSRQQFANDRAEMDAQKRTAAEAAQSLRNQLAAYLKKNPTPPSQLDLG